MIFLVSLLELGIGHVGIDLRCRDGCMTEEFLDYTDISTICQQSCCKRMTERVCVHIFEYACLESVCFHHVGDMEPRQSDYVIREQGGVDVRFTVVVADEERNKVVTTSLEIGLYGISGGRSEINDPELTSLSSYGEFESLEVHIRAIQCCELRYTQSCGVDTLRYRIVSFSLDGFSRDRHEVPLDLFSREECHLSILYSHEVKCGWIETVYLFLLHIFEPRPDRDDMSVHSFCCQA